MFMVYLAVIYGLLAALVLATYAVARLAGMKVRVLQLGTGPVLRRVTTAGGLELAVAPFPGGHVRVAGWTRELEDETTYVAQYGRRGIGERALAALAGPLALLALSMVGFTAYDSLGTHSEVRSPITIASVAPGGAAESAGLQPGDQLEALGGRPLPTIETLVELTQACHECVLTLRRGGQALALRVRPRISSGATKALGIIPARHDVKHSLSRSLRTGTVGTLRLAVAQLQSLLPRASSEPPRVPMAVFATGSAPHPWPSLNLLSLLALYFAILNLLPAPGFAGGYLLLLAAEVLVGRQLSPHAERKLLRIAFLVTVLPLVALHTYADLL